MHNTAVAVGDDLKFNMVRINNQLLQIHLFISKGFLSLVTRTVESRFKTGFVMCRAHPAPATAGSRLNHHRVAEFPRDPDRLLLRLDDSIASGCHWHAGFAGARACSVFISHSLHRTRRWSDKLDIAAFAHLDEMRVLGQKSIAGMNRIDVTDLGCAHDPIDL